MRMSLPQPFQHIQWTVTHTTWSPRQDGMKFSGLIVPQEDDMGGKELTGSMYNPTTLLGQCVHHLRTSLNPTWTSKRHMVYNSSGVVCKPNKAMGHISDTHVIALKLQIAESIYVAGH